MRAAGPSPAPGEPPAVPAAARLLRDGREAFPAMLEAIDQARSRLLLEMYIFAADATGREFRERLAAAARRGVRVMVLADAFGSRAVPDSFWEPLRDAGAGVRLFRPLRRGLLPFRDHRKLLLADAGPGFVGGINIADEYGPGAGSDPPWRDNVLALDGPEAARLARPFYRMWIRSQRPLRRLGMPRRRGGAVPPGTVRLLTSGPENAAPPVRRVYREMIRNARAEIDLAMGYFFPPGRILRELRRAVRRGVRVRLLLAGHSDVAISRWATHGLYGRLLRAGMEVWEYRPAVLHSKLAVVDDLVATGSANLDLRSARMNYELVALVRDAALASRAGKDFESDLKSADRIDLEAWRRRPPLQKVKERVSHFLLARADVLVSRLEIMRRRW